MSDAPHAKQWSRSWSKFKKKTIIPKEQQHLVSHGRVLKDKKTIKSYNEKGGETIEMTLLLVGGRRRDELDQMLSLMSMIPHLCPSVKLGISGVSLIQI